MHDLHLYDENNLSFKQICHKRVVEIEYIKKQTKEDSRRTDIEIEWEWDESNWSFRRVLASRSNENGEYSTRQQYLPDTTLTDAVGDTELLTTFIEKNKITDAILWPEAQSYEAFNLGGMLPDLVRLI